MKKDYVGLDYMRESKDCLSLYRLNLPAYPNVTTLQISFSCKSISYDAVVRDGLLPLVTHLAPNQSLQSLEFSILLHECKKINVLQLYTRGEGWSSLDAGCRLLFQSSTTRDHMHSQRPTLSIRVRLTAIPLPHHQGQDEQWISGRLNHELNGKFLFIGAANSGVDLSVSHLVRAYPRASYIFSTI